MDVVTLKLFTQKNRVHRNIRLFLLITIISLIIGMIGVVAMPGEANAFGAVYSAHEHDGGSAVITERTDIKNLLEDVVFYGVRAIYYVLLMLLTGMLLLGLSIPASSEGNRQRELLDKWSQPVMRAFFIIVIVFVFIHSNEVIRNLGGGGAEWLQLFTDTSSGQSWLALIIVAMIGFIVIKLKEMYRAIYALLLLAVECYNGHVAATDYATLAIVSDFIHLVCSALWAGGVMLLLLFWRTERKEVAKFAGRFVSIAWVTIVVLIVSGFIMTWTIIPSWLYLLHTSWGNWLLVKTILVLLVIALGAGLRHNVKKKEMPSGVLLKLDGLLMTAIIVIVALFTMISPIPDSNPLNVHKMGEDLHFTIEITPNAPGPNEVSLSIWLPEGSGDPKAVSIQLHSIDGSEHRFVEVPLVAYNDESNIEFPGFVEYNYAAEDIILPTKAEWTAELSVTDGLGTKIEKVVQFRND